ncbi:MAG: hypothetical protein JO202_14345 [Ktedonobacteraceae bacterium]|nr:hypothetical protein [Ktedonobacteraceae bacterium]
MHSEGEKGYPWYFLSLTRAWVKSLLVTLAVITGAVVLYLLWYNHVGTDRAPDSVLGLSYAVAGTVCLGLAVTLYTLQRRLRKRALGHLNAALHWHVGFGVMGLALLFMHSFGNFNPLSGTYALYSMIALVISGFIGRSLDHIVPRLIATEVHKALTAQGEDRIETISQQLQHIVVHHTQELAAFNIASPAQKHPRRFASSPDLQTSWDLAYITSEETPQELSRNTTQYRFVPEKRSSLTRPGGLIPGAQEHILAIQSVQTALKREQCYRYIIRYWRVSHIGLAVLTALLTLWHITYAAQLLLPRLIH